MKKFYTTLLMAFALVTSAMSMPYDEAARQAYYLTDKMAYELNLTDYQYDRVYQINFDYFRKVNSEYDAYGYLWDYRNACLASVLYTHQYRSYNSMAYFFRPLQWVRNAWHFAVHERYGYRHNYFCRPTPPPSYRGPVYGHYYGRPGHNHNPGGPGHKPGYNNHKPNGGNYNHNRPGYGDSNRPQPGGSGRYGNGGRTGNNGGNKPNDNSGYKPNNNGGNKPGGNGNTNDMGRRPNVNRGGR